MDSGSGIVKMNKQQFENMVKPATDAQGEFKIYKLNTEQSVSDMAEAQPSAAAPKVKPMKLKMG